MGCCRELSKECPGGPRDTDFFESPLSDELVFSSVSGDQLTLQLYSREEALPSVLIYNECYDDEPTCGNYAIYRYSASTEGGPFEITIGFPWTPNVLTISSGINQEVEEIWFPFDPVDLQANEPEISLFYHESVNLGGEPRFEVYQSIVNDTTARVRELFFNREQSLIGLKLDVEEEVVFYTR